LQLAGGGGGFNWDYTLGNVRTVQSAFTGIAVDTTTSISTEGNSAANANLPPYYALAYIMKA
jgi:hypothetical protein